MRRMSFEEAFTWTVFIISLVLLAVPFFTGEQTLASLFNNKLALIGAAALILLFIYKVPTLLSGSSATRKVDSATPPPLVVQTDELPTGTPGNDQPPADGNAGKQANENRKAG